MCRTQKQVVTLPHAVFDLHFHPRERTLLAVATSAASVSLYRVARSEASAPDLDFPQIQHIWTIQTHEDPTIPALFLAWAPERWFPFGKSVCFCDGSTSADGFAVTFSDGRTSVFTARRGGEQLVRAEFVESQFEPRESIETWFVALATFQPASSSGNNNAQAIPFLFTGNDFGSLQTRRFAPVEQEDPSNDGDMDMDMDLNNYEALNFDDKARHHTAGVTAILPLPTPLIQDSPLLLTGSYDEFIRVYHATPRTKGKVLAETRLGGGVWRLQLIDIVEEGRERDPLTVQSSSEDDSNEDTTSYRTRFLILASCMHAGTRILNVIWRRRRARSSSSSDVTDSGSGALIEEEVGEWDIQLLAKFTEHQSMNYASDFWKQRGDGGGRGGKEEEEEKEENKKQLVCLSSSFYDRRLCLWRVDI